jgi:rhamnogalacturonan acetylesterase
MKTSPLPVPAILVALLLLALPGLRAQDSATPAPAASPKEDHPVEDAAKFALEKPANPALPTLFLVGDSTMKVGTPGQRGWGEEMAPFFDPQKINVVNEAIGGRSSRTFQTEGRWDGVLAMMKAGDYVVIQFGQNDSGAINDNFRARASIPGVGEDTQAIDNMLTHKHEIVHTFGWYMRKYATDVKAKGAAPIIMSLVPRNTWKDGKVVRASGNALGGWAQQAATATGTIYVDDNEVIAEGLDALGQEKTLPLFADGRLHASPAGANFNARMAVSGLKSIQGNPLGPYFSAAADSIPAFAPKQ